MSWVIQISAGCSHGKSRCISNRIWPLMLTSSAVWAHRPRSAWAGAERMGDRPRWLMPTENCADSPAHHPNLPPPHRRPLVGRGDGRPGPGVAARRRASASPTLRWARHGAQIIWCPDAQDRFMVIIGSWNIMAISAPRWRAAASGLPSQLFAGTRTRAALDEAALPIDPCH